MSESRERHAREAMAKAGAAWQVSREGVRKAKVIRELGQQTEEPILAEAAQRYEAEIMAGRMSADRAYRNLTGDDRRPLYMKLPVWLDDELKALADEVGVSRQKMVISILDSFLRQQE